MSDLIQQLVDAQPDTWQSCCRLYAADVAERALDLYGGEVDPRSIECVRVARRYAHGQATDEELRGAKDDARDAEDDAWDDAESAAVSSAAAWSAASARAAAKWSAASARSAARAAGVGSAAERRAHRRRLLQYVEHGIEAENMPWPEIAGGEE